MAYILGEVPEYGIPSQEAGLFVESLSFHWVGNWFEQRNNKGRICGKMLIDEQIDVSISGAVAADASLTWKGGAAITLINTVPDLWQEKPSATTTIITDITHNYSNTDVVKADASATIHAFGAASA